MDFYTILAFLIWWAFGIYFHIAWKNVPICKMTLDEWILSFILGIFGCINFIIGWLNFKE